MPSQNHNTRAARPVSSPRVRRFLLLSALILLIVAGPLFCQLLLHASASTISWLAAQTKASKGDYSFGYATAVATFGALLAAIYAAFQAKRIFEDEQAANTRRFARQEQAENERLMLELQQHFWTTEFYRRRQNAHKLWQYLKGGKFSQDASGSEPADKVMQSAVEWTVTGKMPKHEKFVKAIIEHPEFGNDYPAVGDDHQRNEIAKDLIRSFYEVLSFWPLFVTVWRRLPEDNRADFLRQEWHWTGSEYGPFVENVKSLRAQQVKKQSNGSVPPLPSWATELDEYHKYNQQTDRS